MDFFVENWPIWFSGAGVAVIAWILKKLFSSTKESSQSQVISGGSNNNLAGRDININK